MKYSIFLIAFFLLALSNSVSSQSSALNVDQKKIEQTIQNYFDGWLTGDTTLIGSAMHASCHLKYFPRGEFANRTRAEYLSFFKPRPRLKDAEGRIISIDITLNAAAAKVELEIPGRLYTDYFNLLRIKDRWYIMDKISTNIATE